MHFLMLFPMRMLSVLVIQIYKFIQEVSGLPLHRKNTHHDVS